MAPDSAHPTYQDKPPETGRTSPMDAAAEPSPGTDIRADVPLNTPPATPETGGSTWEEDETAFTSGSRAAVTLLAGCMLAYAQWNANINPATFEGWNRWVGNSVVSNFLLPLGIVWFFFGQNLTFQDWLKDQRHNAWSYGWDFAQYVAVKPFQKIFRPWQEVELEVAVWKLKSKKQDLLLGLGLGAALLPFLIYFSTLPDVKAKSLQYMPIPHSALEWAVLLGGLVIYMFCWEWFFRGFLLFGMAQGFGCVPAIILQAIIFGLAHTGKSSPEMISSYAGGLLLGIICWQRKSFLPAFIAHAVVHVSWAVLVLK